MMARQTKKVYKPAVKATAAKKAAAPKKSAAKKSTFQKLLTADGWKRLMMGKLRKKSK